MKFEEEIIDLSNDLVKKHKFLKLNEMLLKEHGFEEITEEERELRRLERDAFGLYEI